MRTQFTPGPWTAGNTFPTISDWTGRMIAECPVSTSDLDAKDDAFTNARLIAAAPDLYEACEGILANIEDGEPITALETAWLREALTKARGEQVPA